MSSIIRQIFNIFPRFSTKKPHGVAAVLDPADDLLRDVQPDDLELVGELFL